MDPILKVIHFLFKKRNIDIKTNTLESFFDSGLLFPKLVCISFDINVIPQIISNPSKSSEINKNNETALQFLVTNNASIAQINPSFRTKSDQRKLLTAILAKQYYRINESELLNKCNTIVQSKGKQIATIKDLIQWDTLISLYEILSGTTVTQTPPRKNPYDFCKNIFEQSNIPFIIDEQSLHFANRILFMIQIEVLFDFYSEKVSTLISSEANQRKSKLKTTLTFKDSSSLSFNDDITEQTDSLYRSTSIESTDTDTDTDSSVEVIDEAQQMRNLLPKNYNETESETDDSTDHEVNVELSEDDEVGDYDEVFDEEDENFLMIEVPNFKNLPTKEKKTLLRKNKHKNTVNKFILFQEMREKVLLKTINVLNLRTQKLRSIRELVQNDFIPIFVQQFLNVKIENIHLNSNNDNSQEKLEVSSVEEKNIYAVIEYLKKEEPKFDVLNFNFRNKHLVESSAILFFNTFLNFYFLKNTRQQIFKRCVNILFPLTKKDEINEFRILTKWETYVNLVKFVYNTNKRKLKTNEVFDEARIPKLFDEKFLKYCTSQKELPFEIYYQLQFIFNAMEKVYKESLIHEYFMVALKKMKETRVPDSEIITASIRAKNISLILQSRTYKKFVKDNEKDMKQITNEQNQTPRIVNVQKDEITPKTFLDRLKESSNLISVENEEQFWNPQDNSHSFENGVLINKSLDNDQSEKEWINKLTPILGDHQKEAIKQENFEECELYKFFVYDENEKKWKVNINDITKFELQKNISMETKTPIILYLNSNEDEIISFNSQFNSKKCPKIDSKGDEIYVYGTIDYKFEPKNKNNTNIVPIFLHLHVPKSKEKQENIQRVVVSIYSFLYFICDLSIVLMNSKTYKSQIDFIELIEIINKSCSAKFLKRKQALNEKRLLLKKQKEFEKNKKFDDGIVDEIFDSDDDYNFSDDDFEYETENMNATTKAEAKDMRIVFIVNNFINEKKKRFLKENQFLNDLLKKVTETRTCAINPIQSNDPLFNNILIEELNYCIKNNKTTFSEIKEIISNVDHFKLSNTYISLKRKENWKNEITQIINRRYSMYTKDEQRDINWMLIIPRIEKEINNHLLIDDSEFENHCKAVILDLKKKNNINNRQLFKSELEKSATANLQILNQYKDYDFTVKEKVENMINSQVYFIKDEFFNIIKAISDPSDFNVVFEANIDILNERIANDTEDIASMKKNEYQENIDVNDTSDELDQGTNYCIRESVNVREIKVQIECGQDLKTEFEQDF